MGKAAVIAGLGSVAAIGLLVSRRGGRSFGTKGKGKGNKIAPPVAPQRPHQVTFGRVEGENRGAVPFSPRTREDPWFWLRDDTRTDKEVLDHLREENAYAAQETAHLDTLKADLYKEHVSHLKETDDAPPYIYGKYFYYSRTVKGLSYKIHCRKPVMGEERLPSPEAKEEVLLDENKVAEGHSQCVIGNVSMSPDHTKLVYAADFKGDEMYQLVTIDLASRKQLDVILNVSSGLVWGDNDTIFYLTKDATMRPYRMHRHTLAAPQSEDALLLEENDEMFWMGMGKSRSGRFVFAHSGSGETTEIWSVDLHDNVKGDLVVVQPRQHGLLYDVEHCVDNFLVWTNKDDAVNNRLMQTPIKTPSQEHWTEIIPCDPTRKIDDVNVFDKYVAIEGRQGGMTRLWLADISKGGVLNVDSMRQLVFEEELYEVGTSVNKVFSTEHLRIYYSSLVTPARWIDYNMQTAQQTLIKEQQVLMYDRSLYGCKRVFATAPDKTKIPISMVYRKTVLPDDAPPAEPLPCFLYGYGSYGICIDPGFDARILPYLDRGMVYCIAHIRGGGEMGRYWYEEQGKYLNKRNTFSDFVACAEYLIEEKYTRADLMACEGRSAGGLLMGNVLNMRPDLFQVAVAGVPFVDLMNTMCDPSIPLTTGEWEEWGNPNEDKYFDYMLTYSPYDNVRAQPYPHILITAGLHDPRVAYWEPAKWASKLRTLKTNDNALVVKMDLESGHFSASDRYKYFREKSFDQAFVLDKLGLANATKM